MSKTTFEGKTVEAALAQAAQQLGVGQDALEHEVVEEKTDDFWGLGEKVFVVRAWVPGAEEPEPAPLPPAAPPPRREEPPAPTPEPEAAPRERVERAPVREIEPGVVVASPDDVRPDEPTILATQEDLAEDDLPEAAVALLAKIFDAMEFACETQAKMEEDTLVVAISGEDNQFLLDGRGRGLSALELILNHAFRHRTDGGRKKVRVDAGDFRSQRDDEIRDIAYQVAHQAKETGQAQQTRPLNPYERRIVHLTLAEDARVTTRSEGNGFLKAVNVIPQGGSGGGSNRRRD